MADENARILFDEPQILAVAVLVALAVVAILMIPYAHFFRGRKMRISTAVGATVFAVSAVILGELAFTRWALYDGGHGRPPGKAPLSDWLAFAAINAILAAVSAIPGGVMGSVIGRNADAGKKQSVEPSDLA
jgi:hypothetical protein